MQLDYRPSELNLCITNPMSQTTAAPERVRHSDGLPDGHGLIGIRERAALFGGTCRLAQAGHRFEIEVLLPIKSLR